MAGRSPNATPSGARAAAHKSQRSGRLGRLRLALPPSLKLERRRLFQMSVAFVVSYFFLIWDRNGFFFFFFF